MRGVVTRIDRPGRGNSSLRILGPVAQHKQRQHIVATAVTNHTTTVAHTHALRLSICTPSVNIDARISATSVETRPMPPRRTGWPS